MKVLFHIQERVHGAGRVRFEWNQRGTFLASCGANGQLLVHDRNGARVHEASLEMRGACKQVAWSFDGTAIAVCQHGVAKISIFELATRTLSSVSNSAVGEPQVISWAQESPILAAGDGSGNVLLYNMAVRRTIPLVGKHTGVILSAAWSMSGQLAMGGSDDSVTISTSEGDTIDAAELAAEARQICFARQKTDSPSAGRSPSTLTVNMGGRSLLLLETAEHDDKPFELTFQEKYGQIERFAWFGDGYLAVGFQRGFVTVISTHRKELGTEIFTVPLQREAATAMAVSERLLHLAVAGGNTVRILDLSSALSSRKAPPVSRVVVVG